MPMHHLKLPYCTGTLDTRHGTRLGAEYLLTIEKINRQRFLTNLRPAPIVTVIAETTNQSLILIQQAQLTFIWQTPSLITVHLHPLHC